MRTLVVYCHPNPNSFAAALLDASLAALTSAGHDIRVTDLYGQDFDPVLSADEHRTHFDHPATKPDIARHADDLRWCEQIVLVYPTWWGAQPAMLKGWIDRVWINGVAWELHDGANRITPLLRNVRRITAVTTHGSTKLVNALEGEPGKRTLTRSLRAMCSRTCRTRWLALYNIDRATLEQREQFLRRVTAALSH